MRRVFDGRQGEGYVEGSALDKQILENSIVATTMHGH